MATVSSSSFSSQVLVSLKIDRPRLPNNTSCRCTRSILLRVRNDIGSKLSRKQTALKETNNKCSGFSFSGESAAIKSPNLCSRNANPRKRTAVSAMWLPSSQIASSAFTLGTAAVLPFYTVMVIAPKAQLTEKIVASSIPYIVLGLIYAYLLYLSWTPDTIMLMFASKYWLPELSGIAKMFSSEMTLASAWIHLLSVDLFAARQVHNDGLQNDIETRHSVSLCLLFCPIGIITHFITKAVTRSWRRKEHGVH